MENEIKSTDNQSGALDNIEIDEIQDYDLDE